MQERNNSDCREKCKARRTIGVQGGWSGLRKFRMGFPPVPAAAFRTEAARSSHVVGDFVESMTVRSALTMMGST